MEDKQKDLQPKPENGSGAKKKEALETPEAPEKRFYLFNNLETPGANLSYSYLRPGETQHQIYTYEHGQVYQMTPDQAIHLNSLKVAKWELAPDSEGQARYIPAGYTARFSVMEVSGPPSGPLGAGVDG